MKNLILSISIFLCGYEVMSQPGLIKNLNQAKIEFETEIIDYGTIEQNSNGVREFKFTNSGNGPLIISEARKSCGCTIPTWPKEPIKPGENSVIKVKYATNRIGVFNKMVTIISNAERSSIVLRIKGKILQPQTTPTVKKDEKPLAK